MKKLSFLVPIVIVILVVGVIGVLYQGGNDDLKGNYVVGEPITLVGTSANFVKLPNAYVEANSTSTAWETDGGNVVQAIKTEGIEKGLLCGSFKGGTATSSVNIMQMGSFDGTTYFNTASSSTDFAGTTTTVAISPSVITFDPGVTTSTNQCWEMDTEGYVYTRFLLNGEDVSTDPSDQVKGWLQWWEIDKRQD